MREGQFITVQEWAEEIGAVVTEEEIRDLLDALDTERMMSLPCGYGVDRVKSQEQARIENLEQQIDRLERYIVSKGYHIINYDNRIEEYVRIIGAEYDSYTHGKTFR